MDPEVAYTWIVILASIGVFIASVELFTIKEEFEDGGLFSWEVLRTVSSATLSAGTGTPGKWISHPLFVPAVTVGRALAALILICFRNNHALSTVCVCGIVASSLLMYCRAPLGLDGSDQMSLITFVAVAIYKLFAGDIHVAQASLWFIAIQGCLSYSVAGIAKVMSPVWRSGEAVRGILGTRTYGTTRSASFVSRRNGACLALSWLVMSFECTFPLALAFGQTGFAVFAVLGILFHISNAVTMGLNTFVWAFIATYPAILFCAVTLRQ
jgi:vitamin K-dependent gamma-carboxylase-like protein